jgi:cytochrome c5
MNSRTRNRLTLLAAIILCACSPALYMPSLADANYSGISTDNLLLGRALYVNHCSSCHNLHLPEQYTSKHWKEEMPEMQKKAKISDNEAQLIINFLLARSKTE